ncbi:MAG: DMT family transporter [Candidatus Competibacterales bacterium]
MNTGNLLLHAALMLVAGMGIPLMATLNARLGTGLGSPALAVLVLLLVALLVTVLILTLWGWPAVSNPELPPLYYLAGVLFVLYILSITWVIPRFGVGNAVFFVLLGQLICAAVIDHFGGFGAPKAPVTAARLVGLLLMGLGVFLALRRGH